jgi:hypothetical protein
MSSSRPRTALVAALAPLAACSLISTAELQEGATTTAAGSSSAIASGPGPASVASGSSGSSGGEGDGGDASGGSGPVSVASASTGTGAGGGGGEGPGPEGPCGEPSTYADLVLALDPVAYFRMGPDAQSLGTDASADPHDAAAQGFLESVVSPLGVFGGCAMHATTLKDAPALLAWTPPDTALFGDAGVYSLEMWFVVDALPPSGDARFLFAREYADGTRFHLYVTAGGALYWFFDLGGFRQVGYDDANIVPGELHHVVAIRDGAPRGSPNEDLFFYFDGRLREGVSGAGDDPLDDDDDAPLTMPGEASYGAPADGTFDEIAIYDRVLTQVEVRSHFCAIVDDIAICP